ncbi:Integrase [Fulvimarina manganoxydans]|uniref:Integrase n=1 Tax=Fulvimarina manganoxydans TaxID=937218 RepID=A0A1W2E9G7_9HYPH|nr:site-specific integrase [Fulvimarina manganoxydans]SMD06381.1 Integrase [Fulvimarina manganoxydans]
MARNKLSETAIKAITKPGIYSDGDGLFLRVRKGGSKSWVFIHRRGGKRDEVGLGGYGQGTAPVTLKRARQRAELIRERIADGEDVRVARDAVAPVAPPPVVTFKDCVDATIAIKTKEFRNEKHKAQWRMVLEKYAKPLHDKPVAAVTVDDIVRCLTPHWEKRPETADRLRQRIGAVMDYAKARGLRTGDNPAAWRGNLSHLLPARQKLARGHHAALPFAKVPAMVGKLRRSKGTAARAVEFLTLTAVRTGEVRDAVWSEFDFDDAVWTIPALRMKAAREHRVPLTPRMIAILRERQTAAIGPHVFGGQKNDKPVSATAMTKALRAAAPDDAGCTLHGLRSAFRDWCGEETDTPREIAEAALAHNVGNAVELAYRRGDALEKRSKLMLKWEAYCRKT